MKEQSQTMVPLSALEAERKKRKKQSREQMAYIQEQVEKQVELMMILKKHIPALSNSHLLSL